MNQLMLAQVAPADDPFNTFQTDLTNLQIDIWQLELERARLTTLLRIRRVARAQLARRYRQLVQHG